PQEFRLLMMRNRLPLPPRGIGADIRLRRTILTIRPFDPLRTIMTLRPVAARIALLITTIPVAAAVAVAPIGVSALATTIAVAELTGALFVALPLTGRLRI